MAFADMRTWKVGRVLVGRTGHTRAGTDTRTIGADETATVRGVPPHIAGPGLAPRAGNGPEAPETPSQHDLPQGEGYVKPSAQHYRQVEACSTAVESYMCISSDLNPCGMLFMQTRAHTTRGQGAEGQGAGADGARQGYSHSVCLQPQPQGR